MNVQILVECLKRGHFIVGVGHVASVNIYRDESANQHSAREGKEKKFSRLGYSRQVAFEQDVQYRPAATGRVSVSLVGGGIKNYDIGNTVNIYAVKPTNALAA